MKHNIKKLVPNGTPFIGATMMVRKRKKLASGVAMVGSEV